MIQTVIPTQNKIDTERVRADFPILGRQIHGNPLVFLDSCASSQKPLAVLEAMDGYYRTSHANVHRGVYTLSEEATAQYESARQRVAGFINANSPKEVIWTRNATEGINLVTNSSGRANLGPGDHILLTEMEHHANLVPWQMLAMELDLVLDFVPVADDGTLVLDHLGSLLGPRTRLFGFTAMSNVLGTINPVAELVEIAHNAGALVLVDAAQSVPHMPTDVQALGADFLVFSAHKMLGPTGVGVLWARRQLLESMPPFMGGGDMIQEVELQRSVWADLPWKFEAGTPAIAEAIGLAAAIEYLEALGMDQVWAHEQSLIAYALERLAGVPGLTVLGPGAAQRGGLASFTLDGVHPHDVAAVLDSLGIAVRAGHHCAQPIHRRFHVPATTRASFYVYNTPAEIDKLVAGLHHVVSMFSI